MKILKEKLSQLSLQGRAWLVMVLLMLVSNPGLAANSRLLVLGDSISAAYGMNIDQGWVSLLQKSLTQGGNEIEIINAAISGDTARTGKQRLPDLLQRHSPDIVIIALGGNDGLRGRPIADIKGDLSAAIDNAQQANSRVLLLAMDVLPSYGPRYSDAFNKLYHELAVQHQVTLVPSLLREVAALPNGFQADGIHPSQSAQSIIKQRIEQYLLPLL